MKKNQEYRDSLQKQMLDLKAMAKQTDAVKAEIHMLAKEILKYDQQPAEPKTLRESIEQHIALDFSLDSERIEYLTNIVEHGCASGAANQVIYYHDTVKLFDKYRSCINEMMAEFDVQCPMSDPLAENHETKNNLVWFCYETICDDILCEMQDYRAEHN